MLIGRVAPALDHSAALVERRLLAEFVAVVQVAEVTRDEHPLGIEPAPEMKPEKRRQMLHGLVR